MKMPYQMAKSGLAVHSALSGTTQNAKVNAKRQMISIWGKLQKSILLKKKAKK